MRCRSTTRRPRASIRCLGGRDGRLSEHAARLRDFLALPRHVELLVLDPAPSYWYASRAEERNLLEAFAQLQNELLAHGIDYYLIDPSRLVTLELEDGAYRFGKDHYRILLLPPATRLDEETEASIARFRESGGTVVEGDGADAIAAVEAALDPPYRLRSPLLETGALRIVAAHADDGLRYFVKNLSATAGSVELVEEGRRFAFELAAHEATFVDGLRAEAATRSLSLDLDRPYRQRLLGPNALRLAEWELETEDGQRAVVDSFPLIDQYEAAGIRIAVEQQPWFGCPKELRWPAQSVRYRQCFHSELATGHALDLVIEPGSLLGDWTISLNGRRFTADNFETSARYLPTNLVCAIGDAVVPGENELVVELSSELSFGGLRNPLYIMGDMGVRREGTCYCLTALPSHGSILDRAGSGLPFYAGRIAYALELEADGYDMLELDDPRFEDSLTLVANGEEIATQAWSPRRFALPAGAQHLEAHVDTTLIGLFEGQVYDREEDRYVDLP